MISSIIDYEHYSSFTLSPGISEYWDEYIISMIYWNQSVYPNTVTTVYINKNGLMRMILYINSAIESCTTIWSLRNEKILYHQTFCNSLSATITITLNTEYLWCRCLKRLILLHHDDHAHQTEPNANHSYELLACSND